MSIDRNKEFINDICHKFGIKYDPAQPPGKQFSLSPHFGRIEHISNEQMKKLSEGFQNMQNTHLYDEAIELWTKIKDREIQVIDSDEPGIFNNYQRMPINKIVASCKREQKKYTEKAHLLNYLTNEETQRLEKARQTPQSTSIAPLIKEGKWREAFNPQDPQDSFYAALAGYCDGHIDLEDVTTAFMFFKALHATKGECKILPINEENLRKYNCLKWEGQHDENAIKDLVKSSKLAKENQRYLLLVPKKELDEYTVKLLEVDLCQKLTFIIPGFLGIEKNHFSQAGTVGFGMLKQLYPELSPVIHLTPTMEEMIEHIEKGQSDFALFFPEELPMIHGSIDSAIWPILHDITHCYARKYNPHFKQVLVIANKIQIPPTAPLAFQKKLSTGEGEVIPRFIKMPSAEEAAWYVLYTMKGILVDGNFLLNVQTLNELKDQAVTQVFKDSTLLQNQKDLEIEVERIATEKLRNFGLL